MIKILYIYFFLVFILIPVSGITQNKTDDNNKKQGHWVFTNKTRGLPGYKNDQIVEEGNFKDSRKTGVWTFYFNNGRVKHTITYINNNQNGPAMFYYKNGNLKEKGIWKNNRWVGDYEKYYSNGRLKNKFIYNNQGLKHGLQMFYQENGNLKEKGIWKDGIKQTDIDEYQTSEKADTIRNDTIKSNDSISVDSIIKTKKVVVKKYTNPNLNTFDGNGYHEFKDKKGRNIRVGEFNNGYLIEGKTFEYDINGNITVIKIIENGKIIKILDSLSIYNK